MKRLRKKEIWRKSRRMLESSMSALTRAASRCYVYHAPIKISSNARVPAQVRMMRSWGAEEKDSDKKENSLAEKASVWVDELGGSAEYKEFSPKQREGTDYEKDDPNDSDVLDLQSELGKKKGKFQEQNS